MAAVPDDDAFYRFIAVAAGLARQESFPVRAQAALAALVVAARNAGIAAALLADGGFWEGIEALVAEDGDEDVAWAAMELFLFAAESARAGDARVGDVRAHPALEELCRVWEAREMAPSREPVRVAFLGAFRGMEFRE
jgi:hypothetical protein